ncbi:MAG: hypothetical protein V1704_02095 [Candidatus Vogelbacteria bacterium]
MKKFIFGLIIIVLLVIVIGVISEKNKVETPLLPSPVPNPALSVTSRSFQMGFVPITAQPLSTENWLAAFDLFKNNAEVVMHHVNFASEGLAGADYISQMADRYGLKKFLVIDPLASDRQTLDPNLKVLGGSFADTKVRQAYKDLAVKLASTYHPTYLGLASEINTYLAKNPNELATFVSLLDEIKTVVKQVAPATIVTLSVQYEELSGTTGKPAQWEMLKQLEAPVDAIAFTTYPSAFFSSPDKLPVNYYTRIRNYTAKPILIAESGWPTSGSSGASVANQTAFLNRLPELTKDLNIRLWIWWFPYDWAGDGYPTFFKTMGLRQASGEPKASWNSWAKIHNLPIR